MRAVAQKAVHLPPVPHRDQIPDRDLRGAQGALKARGVELAKQQESLLDKMLRNVVDEPTYKKKNAEIEEQMRLARVQYQEAAGDEWDLETATRLACTMVQNAARLWFEMPLENRQRLQGALFLDGLAYTPGHGLGTAATHWPAKEMKEIAAANLKLAPPRGIEPLLPG